DTLAKIGTAMNGWNSPGSFTWRSTGLETTRTTSTGAWAATIAAAKTMTDTTESLCAWFIVSTHGIIRIQRWGNSADPRLKKGVHRRENNERGKGRQEQPADDRAAQWRALRPV